VSVIVDKQTRLCVSGITGREGSFHTLNNRAYGTQVVSGVTPGKGGLDLEGIPVFNTFREAVAASDANTAMVFVRRPSRRIRSSRRPTPGSRRSSRSPKGSPPTTSCGCTRSCDAPVGPA